MIFYATPPPCHVLPDMQNIASTWYMHDHRCKPPKKNSLFRMHGVDGNLKQTQTIDAAHIKHRPGFEISSDHVEIILFHFTPNARHYFPMRYDINILTAVRTKTVLNIIIEHGIFFENFIWKITSTHRTFRRCYVINETERDETTFAAEIIRSAVRIVFDGDAIVCFTDGTFR